MRKKTKKRLFTTLIILILLVFGCLYFFKGYFVKKTDDEEVPKIEEKIKEYNVSFTLAGNVLINSNMWNDTRTNEGYDFEPVFQKANDIMKKSDVNFYFQGSILGGKDLGSSLNYNYNSPDELINALTKMKFNMVSLASYHSYDKGINGITNSIKLLKDKEVAFSGVRDSEKEEENNIITKRDVKIGLLSYTIGTDENRLEDYAVNIYSDEKAKSDIEKIKNKVDILIVSIDWNNLNSVEVTENQKEIATTLSNLGANIIVGNNSYSIQPIEKINDTLVCYSLGNLLSGHTLVDSRISAMADFNVKVTKENETKVDIGDVNISLYYTYNINGGNYKVIPFAEIEDELTNYKEYYDKYKELLTKDNNNIKFYNIGD